MRPCARGKKHRSQFRDKRAKKKEAKKKNSKTAKRRQPHRRACIVMCVHGDTRAHSTVSSHEPCSTSCDRSYTATRLFFFSLFPRFPSIRKEIRKQRTGSFCHVTHQPTNTQEKHQWPSKPLDSALRTKSFKREMKRN